MVGPPSAHGWMWSSSAPPVETTHPRVRARGVAGGDEASHRRGGAAGGADLAEPARVRIGDDVPPFEAWGRQGELASQVGHDGPVAAEVAGEVVEADEGGNVDPQLDETGCLPTSAVVRTRQQLDEEVGPQLVHRPGIAGTAEPAGEAGQVRPDGRRVASRQVDADAVGGAVRVGVHLDAPPLHGRLVPLDGSGGIQREHQAPHPPLDLGGGAVGCPIEHGVDEVMGGVRVEMGRLVDQHPGAHGVDAPRRQRSPHRGQPVPQRQRVGIPARGGRSREAQRGLDLGSGRLVDVVAGHGIGCELGRQRVADRGHRPRLAGGIVRFHASLGAQRDDAVVARQPVDVDGREGGGERRSR